MDAATAALTNAALPNAATAYAPAVNTPAVKSDRASGDARAQGQFQDLMAANLRSDQADADQARDEKTATARADAAPRPASQPDSAATAKNSAKAKPVAVVKVAADPSEAPDAAQTGAEPAAPVKPLDPSIAGQVVSLVNKIFGAGNGGGTGQPVLNAASRKKLTDTIDSLLAGLPLGQRTAALTALQTVLTPNGFGPTTLTAGGAAIAQSGAGALIAAGLTPQQMAGLAGAIDGLLGSAVAGNLPAAAPVQPAGGGATAPETGTADDGSADGSDAAGTLLPATEPAAAKPAALPATTLLTAPPLKRDPIFSLRTAPAAPKAAGIAADAAIAASIAKTRTAPQAAQLNALTTDSGGNDGVAADSRAAHPFDNVLQIFAHSQNAPSGGAAPVTSGTAAAPAAAVSAAAKSAATVILATAATAAIAAPADTAAAAAAQSAPDGGAWAAQLGASAPATVLPLTNAAMLTSLVTNAATAGASHPATQAVASAVLQAGEEGEDSSITVSLDPAELGKVQVRLQIGKDQSVKAHLLVEKPETYMMLQRDQHVLQKHLQDSGLDANSGALSFELAQGGMNFSQDNREGNASQGGTGAGAGGDNAVGTVLETTMTWTVDPQSGMTHYNLLA